MRKIILILLILSSFFKAYTQSNATDSSIILGSFINKTFGDWGVEMTISYKVDPMEPKLQSARTYCLSYEGHKYFALSKREKYQLFFKNNLNQLYEFRTALLSTISDKKGRYFYLGDQSIYIGIEPRKKITYLIIYFADAKLIVKEDSMGKKEFSEMMKKAYQEKTIVINYKKLDENYVKENLNNLFGY